MPGDRRLLVRIEQLDENLGDVNDVIVEKAGMPSMIVVGVGGFLGIGEKYFAVPWHALTMDTDNHRFILDVDKERLKDAQGFDKDHWPDFFNALTAYQPLGDPSARRS